MALGANKHIWVMNADGSHLRQVTKGNLSEGDPSWSPDGRRIGAPHRHEQIWVVSANGGPLRRVSHRTTSCVAPAWSPNGRWIAYSCTVGFPKLVLARVGGHTDRLVTHAAGVIAEEDATWTPDSRMFLFTRRSGYGQAGVYSISTTGHRLRRVAAGGSEPSVSPDGRWLAFVRNQHLWIARRSGTRAHGVTLGTIAVAGPDWGSR